MRKSRTGISKWAAKSIIAAALMLALAAMSGGIAEAAGYEVIKRVVGTDHPLNGEPLSYNVYLVTTQTKTATLGLRVDCAGTGTGTQIDFAARKISEGASSGTCTITPEKATINNGSARTTIEFADVTNGDVFSIEASMRTADDKDPGTSSNALIVVRFTNPVEVTGVAIDKGDKFSIRKSTTSSIQDRVFLTAMPTPNNATDVDYVWSSTDPSVVVPTATGSVCDLQLGNGADKGKTATISVTANGYNGSTATASCDITVRGDDELADDMAIKPDDDTSQKAPIVYGVNGAYVSAVYNVQDDTIQTGAALGNNSEGQPLQSQVVYAKDAKSVDIKSDRTKIANSIGLSDFDKEEISSRFISAISMDIDVEHVKNNGKIALVPLKVAFPIQGKYLNGKDVDDPVPSNANIGGSYRVTKYVDKDSSAPLSNAFDPQDIQTGAYSLKQLIVMVDSIAPQGAQRIGKTDAGYKIDTNRNIIYIYDGKHDGKIQDPLVLEHAPRRTSGGGGGGGGCAAGAGVLIGIASLGLLVLRSRMRSDR